MNERGGRKSLKFDGEIQLGHFIHLTAKRTMFFIIIMRMMRRVDGGGSSGQTGSGSYGGGDGIVG